ncbi:hypothetical protein CDAR_243211 [Caerostris darwini]|uniref:Uncharacterized protein n=1 Tax=Caerostris darwini TaxID=1538125 RepID=A0AAV4MMU6_9ARAC|nr:hypothetical protein CDAR_243211 [Caerostris darwini]
MLSDTQPLLEINGNGHFWSYLVSPHHCQNPWDEIQAFTPQKLLFDGRFNGRGAIDGTAAPLMGARKSRREVPQEIEEGSEP